MQKPTIGIVGLGIVGTPMLRWFTQYKGYQRNVDLFCYDTDPKLGFHDDVYLADWIFVCVPTPPNSDGSCNISIVKDVVAKIPDNKLVIIKSTVLPGTTQCLQDRYKLKRFIFNPEFLTESNAWEDFIHPSRQILGVTVCSQPESINVLQMLPLASFTRPSMTTQNGGKVLSATEAELAKYASNIFGYIKVVYGNMLADVCHVLQRYGDIPYHDHVSYENVRD